MYSPDEVPTPEAFHAPHGKLPPHVQWLHDRRADCTAVKNTQAVFACSEREAREAIALNYGSITFIDDSIGRVLAELERLGLAENTVVIFTADHGDYMGDHQLLLKAPVHYRGLVRIPFIWHDPMRPAQGVSDALTQSIDIAPTILERAGITEWNGIQGRSMLPLMSSEPQARAATRRSDLLIEEEGQRYYMGFADRIRMRTLRDARYRLSVYDGVSWGELYDLEADPLETQNLWDEPTAATVRASMTERMARAMIELAETSPYPERIA
jgi:arylsulfatase A-like enzyme